MLNSYGISNLRSICNQPYAVTTLAYIDFFFFNDTATTEIYTLSLHDALPISPQTKHAVREFLSRRGTSTYVFTVTDLAYSGPKQFFTRVEDALKEAKEVWMCVGEMGFRLMERDEIINGINFAAKHNGASIKVIHGPRTDPKTKRIFDLAKDGLVELFQLENYPSHHFLYIVSKTGRRLLIDESPHLEPVRARNQAGMVVEFYRS